MDDDLEELTSAEERLVLDIEREVGLVRHSCTKHNGIVSLVFVKDVRGWRFSVTRAFSCQQIESIRDVPWLAREEAKVINDHFMHAEGRVT